MKYRVKEYQGKFYVQVLKEQINTVGYCWWKEEIKTDYWVDCSENGRPPIDCFRIGFHTYAMPPFKTLDAAMKQIELFISPIKFHYPA